jgi:ferrous iron transport protein B
MMTVQASSLSGPSAFTIALAGQPNTGKSTVFNQLTGARQHVGNWPGKTVEQKSGTYSHQGTTYRVVDLPGTYSLAANSLEETISRDFIIGERPDAVVVLVDAAQLERTMYLLAEVLPLPARVIVALNMMDVAEQEGRRIDVQALEQRLGVPVVPMVAARRRGVPELIETIHRFVNGRQAYTPSVPEVSDAQRQALVQIKDLLATHVPLGYPPDWVAIKLLEGDTNIKALVQREMPAGKWTRLEEIMGQNGDGALALASARYAWIQQVIHKAVRQSAQSGHAIRRGRFDRIATHPLWGIPLAVLVMLVAFGAAMVIAMPVMMGAMSGLPLLIDAIRQAMVGAPAWLSAMLADGLLPGIGMALAFLGFLFGMFLVIGFVEDVGYLARMAFVGDRFMSRIGLHGKSFLPMLTSLGCNVAGVLGSRVVDTWQQRMMTLVMAPIVPCLAVWGVVGFFGTLFFGAAAPLVTAALLMALIAWLLFTGLLFKRLLIKEEPGGLIMELPPYHRPNWKTIWSFTWGHTKSFIVRGMTLVAAASVVIWALSYLPHGNIETSILGTAGRAMEPVGSIIGLDWRLMVALIASMASKEAALATLGVLYGLSSGAGSSSLTGLILGAEAVEHTAIATAIQSSVTPASALAFVFAAFFSVPCLGTLGAIYSETRSWKWTLGATAYYTATAILAGFLAYRVGLLIF